MWMRLFAIVPFHCFGYSTENKGIYSFPLGGGVFTDDLATSLGHADAKVVHFFGLPFFWLARFLASVGAICHSPFDLIQLWFMQSFT